jgi:L-ascorbate metabolism protein UlaG (beta-lactamase superfamily)
MIVTWLGHSCFFLKSDEGHSLLLDPFHEYEVGYSLPPTRADIVIISHDHLDHNNAVDLLFLPVGGRYTIDAVGANKVMNQLHPSLTVPMHYQTPALSFELDPVDDFLKGKRTVKSQERLILAKKDLSDEGSLGDDTLVVLLSCPGAEGAGRSID